MNAAGPRQPTGAVFLITSPGKNQTNLSGVEKTLKNSCGMLRHKVLV
jgi:hypothetical protein